MKPTRWIFLSLTGLAVLLASAYAVVTSKTFRTTAQFNTFTQGHETLATLAGHNLVNLAMGRTATSTAVPTQVLALTLPCTNGTANLVVYDQSTASIVTTIASASSYDTVWQIVTNRDNQVRFLAQFEINPTGNSANGLLGGYLTVAGRIHANRTNGCPESVPVRLDFDRHDYKFGDQDVLRSVDPDSEPATLRTGLAHCVGVIDAVRDGTTSTILIPFGNLSIRGEQP